MSQCEKIIKLASVLCLFLIGFTAPSFAASNPGHCANGNNSAAGCQYEVLSYTQAPPVTESYGVRLDQGVSDILFNNYPSIGPRFISNTSGGDLFVPQNSSPEFLSFLQASSADQKISTSYAVAPQTYVATPQTNYRACNLSLTSAGSVPLSVPSAANSTSPVIVNSYTLMSGINSTKTVVGSTAWQSSPSFAYSRQDCSTDQEGNKQCTTVKFIEDQELVFSVTGTAPNYNWGAPAVTSSLYVSLNGGPYASVNSCSASYAPAINGICGPVNGQSPAQIPTSGLCSSGNPGAVSGDGPWSWTCSGINQGTSQTCATAPDCNLPWGGSILSGESVTAYESATVPYGTNCEAETRTCSSGTLSGSYGYQSCTVDEQCVQNLFGYQCGGETPSINEAHAYVYDVSGYGTNAAYMSSLTPEDRMPNINLYTTEINIPDQSYTLGFPSLPQLTQWFGVCYDAGWTAPANGNYTFVTSVDDAVGMWIDGNLVGQNNYGDVQHYVFTDTGSMGPGDVPEAYPPIYLNAGLHDVVIKYIQGWPTNLGLRVWALPVNQGFGGGTPSDAYFMQFVAPPGQVVNCP